MNFPVAWKRALLLFALVLPAFARAQYTFTTNTDGSLNISAVSNSVSGAWTIVDTYNGLPITTVGDNAFHLSGVSSVTMGTNIVSIGNGAFESCYALKSVNFGSNLGYIGNGAFSSDPALRTVVIPDSVTNIGNDVFMECTKLYSATLGAQVSSLPGYTFNYCTSLTNVVLGASVASFGNAVFTQCPLVAITVDPANQFFSSSNGVFFDKNKTELIWYPNHQTASTYIIPDTVNVIGMDAFYACLSLTNIVIPDLVTDLQTSAFSACSGLMSVTVGKSVANVEDAAFQGCTGLTSVVLPNSVGIIGQFAFYSCGNLTNVVIGTGVTNIVGGAFLSCPNLLGVYFRGNAPVSSESFSQDNLATAYYLPGTLGWTPRFGDPYGLPTAPWFLPTPMILNFETNFGVQPNGFGFTISWATNTSVVVEASTDFTTWTPIATNMLASGAYYFSDSQWTNAPGRFYRVRSP